MAADTPLTLEEAQRLYADKPAVIESAEITSPVKALVAEKDNDAAKARSLAVIDVALGVGVKTGLAWQLKNINRAIKQHERDFDSVYDFGRIMIRDRVVPPVITESRDLYNQDGDYALRLSGAYYKIEYQARFSSVSPNWRGYLTFPIPAVDRISLISGIKPRNDEERNVWEIAVKDGWQQGVTQANVMLQYGLDRLNRDLMGMLRFHTFVMQGKITLPAIATESIPVTQSGPTMAVDETLLRITTLPEFNSKMINWKSSITSSYFVSPPKNVTLENDNREAIQ